MTSARRFGFELEYASGVRDMLPTLLARELLRTDEPHTYHCDCNDCAIVAQGETFISEDEGYGPLEPPDLHCQRDSTADGEFITRILDDWGDLRRIAAVLTDAAERAGARTSNRCGLHVHVDTNLTYRIEGRLSRRTIVPRAYLAFERYFTEIVAPGTSIRKRDMNTTLMQAVRQFVSDGYTPNGGEAWLDLGRNQIDTILLQAIQRDRHVDLNFNNRHNTWEFRAFNATNAAWRIELACRLSVAFVEAAPQLCDEVEQVVRGSKFWPAACDSAWGEIIRPAYSDLPAPHPTKRPCVSFERFIDILCDVDPDLRPLIERQGNFMRTKYAREVVPA